MVERVIIGADLSTKKVAFVGGILDGPYRMQATNISSLAEAEEAADDFLLDTIKFIGSDWDVQSGILAVIEEPLSGRGGIRPAILQGYISGVVQLALQKRGSEILMISNSKWKKVVTGRGNADKEFVKKWLEKNWQECSDRTGGDQDLIDASCIFRYGLVLQHRRRVVERSGGLQGIVAPILWSIQRGREQEGAGEA